jgi:hypothetical protein
MGVEIACRVCAQCKVRGGRGRESGRGRERERVEGEGHRENRTKPGLLGWTLSGRPCSVSERLGMMRAAARANTYLSFCCLELELNWSSDDIWIWIASLDVETPGGLGGFTGAETLFLRL